MFREIKKKQLILERRKPYRLETQQYIQELNLLDWATCSMRLDGSQMGRKQIECVLKGEYLENYSLMEHEQVNRYHSLVAAVQEAREMSYSIDLPLLLSFQDILTGGASAGYRRSNPILPALDHNPAHPSVIETQLAQLMRWLYTRSGETNPIRKAAVLHHRIIEIYPFESCSEAVARTALYYYLMENGLPPFEMDLSEQAYYAAIAAYLKQGEEEAFLQTLEQSLFKKMEVLMQLTTR